MPGLASRLTDAEIWSMIEFLDAQSAARNASAMTERVKPLLPVPAPDFTYELPGSPQQTLLDPRDKRVTLLVFYRLPASLPRLTDIATNLRSYVDAGARVVAVPLDAATAAEATSGVSGADAILATTGADVAAAYTLFAQSPPAVEAALPPVEYLIDRQGDLRVRWIGVPGSERGAESLSQIRILVREPPRPVQQWGHRH